MNPSARAACAQLNVCAIDLANITDDDGRNFTILRLITEEGMRVDVPILSTTAAQFGRSLTDYASGDEFVLAH
jgi:hypothetical protein